MVKIFVFVQMIVLAGSLPLFSQQPDKATLAGGVNLIHTKTYTAEEDAQILELYKDLRVADVSDGMDMAGLPGTGLVDPAIHPDWVDLKDFTHVFRGIAVTVRYVPTQRPALPAPGEDFAEWEGNFYNTYSTEAFTPLIKPGTASLSLMMSRTVISAP